MPVLTLAISAAKAAPGALGKVVAEGTLLEILGSIGDVELNEAKSALLQLPDTVDKNAAIWTAIGHLQTARGSYERIYLPRSFNRRYLGSGIDKLLAWSKDMVVRSALYICYMSIGERDLAEKTLDDMESSAFTWQMVDNVGEYRELENGGGGVGAFLGFVTPRRMMKFYQVAGTAYLHPIRSTRGVMSKDWFNAVDVDEVADFIETARKQLRS